MEKSKEHRIALVVDLDNTLVRTNTLFELMSILCPLRYIVLSRLLKPISLLNNITGRDLYKQVLARVCFYSRSREHLEHAARIYYEKFIRERDRYNYKILNILKTFKYGPKILLTASSDFIAMNFKRDGFDIVYSSESIYRNEVFHSIDDLYLRKHLVIRTLSKFFNKIMVIDDEPEKELCSIPDVKIIRTRYRYE